MKIWIDRPAGQTQVNFQGESEEERKLLDKLLGLEEGDHKEIPNDRDKSIGNGASCAGILSGHKSQ